MNLLKTFLPFVFGNKVGKSYKLPQSIDWGSLSLEEELTLKALSHSLRDYSTDLGKITLKEFYHLLNFEKGFKKDFRTQLKNKYFHHYFYFNEAKSARALFANETQEVLDFKNQELSVFVLLNSKRNRPGRVFIRNSQGEFARDQKGDIWSLPILGRSRKGLAFCHSNGNTPQGVMRINSVMPEANNQLEFGKYRRLKLDFLGHPCSGDKEVFSLIPKTHHQKCWWKQAQVARDMGRSLLRIHGTGEKNFNLFSYHFPMVPSSGCLTMREFSYLGLNFDDQRKLLDQLMLSQGLKICYDSELEIKGLLYVIDFDGTYRELEFK